jgi:hypothetical protein
MWKQGCNGDNLNTSRAHNLSEQAETGKGEKGLHEPMELHQRQGNSPGKGEKGLPPLCQEALTISTG